ncbi:hypothetical protein V2H45_08955 [Tumidithrix elongata RA019]|uniref:Transposase n=1 Tax=Tumidithrix elongata BACA0141 TaxID=2716417 RepID=A0AAW9Q2M1_9CYAN|nr:hypothetical protein [Tumidithrix elongata RA019]
MAKLSIADKKEILRLYCETDATTTQLAKQYEISSSTVLRLLQELIPAEEYKQIVGQKQSKVKKSAASPAEIVPSSALPKASPQKSPQPRINQLNLIDNLSDPQPSFHGAFKSAFGAPSTEPDFEPGYREAVVVNPTVTTPPVEKIIGKPITKQALLKRQAEELLERQQAELQERLQQELYVTDTPAIAYNAPAPQDSVLASEVGNDLGVDPEVLLSEINNEIIVEGSVDDEFDEDEEEDGDDSDLLDEDDLDEDFEEDDESDGEFEDISAFVGGDPVDASVKLNILPLEDAELPSTCYMVVDKSAEIITRPLRDFKELGLIPPEENQARTVALFDNHRIARRFSNQNQRVIKFPGDLIYATHEKLAQKGITRLLFGGHVYAL